MQRGQASECFNPHPARRPDATVDAPHLLGMVFQSLKAGCNSNRSHSRSLCFNPHPARRPDATVVGNPPDQSGGRVSILIQPEGRMQRWAYLEELPALVSILIQPEGRMQPLEMILVSILITLAGNFVSILIQPEGRMQRVLVGHLQRFHLSARVSILIQPEGRMQHRSSITNWYRPQTVSILIQPEGRMQQGLLILWNSRLRSCFNPHPARRPDATRTVMLAIVLGQVEFQSSSSPKAGCNALGAFLLFRGRVLCFNPHPARRPDATGSHRQHQHAVGGVSILIQPEGRMQRGCCRCSRNSSPCFNPHPARRPDATCCPPRCPRRGTGFNPHPARRPDATPVGQFSTCSTRTSATWSYLR